MLVTIFNNLEYNALKKTPGCSSITVRLVNSTDAEVLDVGVIINAMLGTLSAYA